VFKLVGEEMRRDGAAPRRAGQAGGPERPVTCRGHCRELSYTSWRLKPYAEQLGDHGPPFHWHVERRALLWADLDAAFLHVYGLSREEAEHILDSFVVLRKYDERDFGE
jgi:hypothetical protein